MLISKDNYIDHVLQKYPQFVDEYKKNEEYYSDILYVFTHDFLCKHIEEILIFKIRKRKEVKYFFEVIEYIHKNGDNYIQELIHVEVYVNLFYVYGMKLNNVIGRYVGSKGRESIKVILDWNKKRSNSKLGN